MTPPEICAVLIDQLKTAHALKLARARKVLACVQADMKAAAMWAQVAIATADLAMAAGPTLSDAE